MLPKEKTASQTTCQGKQENTTGSHEPKAQKESAAQRQVHPCIQASEVAEKISYGLERTAQLRAIEKSYKQALQQGDSGNFLKNPVLPHCFKFSVSIVVFIILSLAMSSLF